MSGQGEWGTPEFYVEELRAVRDALAPSKASGVCNGAALTIEKLMRRAAPTEAASEPEYDVVLIADMLCVLAGNDCGYTEAAIREQAELLRAADNREASGVRTVNRSEPASGEAVAWVKGSPSSAGIYRVRGWSFGRPKDTAVVVVALHKRELRVNLHESTSATKKDDWAWLGDMCPDFEWQRVDALSAPPSTIPAAEVEGLVASIESVLAFVPDRGVGGMEKDALRQKLAALLKRNG